MNSYHPDVMRRLREEIRQKFLDVLSKIEHKSFTKFENNGYFLITPPIGRLKHFIIPQANMAYSLLIKLFKLAIGLGVLGLT